MRASISKAGAISAAALLALLAIAPPLAQALDIVLDDVAPDRVERQRHFARGELPLAGTPRLDKLDERLKALDLTAGRPIYIRIFKAESELELWLQSSSGTFTRLATYQICHWTGSLGPKLKEGDKQSPEGFYSVGAPQTRLVGRWRRAFNLGFPNLHDQLLSRTGSYILIHGGCSSVGCFAMTDEVQEEIYGLARAALAQGQERFQVHIFPFRMTHENVARYAGHEWAHTWADLKPAYDSFERTRVPPRVAVCGVRYKIADGLPGETGDDERRLPLLRPVSNGGPTSSAASVLDENGNWVAPACELEDEDKRRAYYASAPVTTSSTSSTPVPTPAKADTAASRPIATVTSAAATASAATARSSAPARPVVEARPIPRRPAYRDEAEPQIVRKPRSYSYRAEHISRPIRREATASRPRAVVPSVDGFGSATFRANQRVSATGG